MSKRTVCEQGALGLNAIVDDSLSYKTASEEIKQLKESELFYTRIGEKPPVKPDISDDFFNENYAACRNHSESSDDNAFDSECKIDFVTWGKVHRYPASEFDNQAPHYWKALIREGQYLYDSILFDQRMWREVFDLPAIVDFFMPLAAKVRAADVLRKYDALLDECRTTLFQLLLKRFNYSGLLETGLEYMRIRDRQFELLGRGNRLNGTMRAWAEKDVEYLRFVENTAFEALDLMAKAAALLDPIREAVYRITVVIIRAGATTAGEAAAGSSKEDILRALEAVLLAKVPDILAQLCVNLVGRYAAAIGVGDTARDAIKAILGAITKFIFRIIFGAMKPVPINEKFLLDLAEELLTDAISDTIGIVFGLKKGGATREYAKIVVQSGIGTVGEEFRAAQQEADKPPRRPVIDVFLARLPWAIVNMAKSICLTIASGKFDRMAKADAAARLQKEIADRQTNLDKDAKIRAPVLAAPYKETPVKDDEPKTSRPPVADVEAATGKILADLAKTSTNGKAPEVKKAPEGPDDKQPQKLPPVTREQIKKAPRVQREHKRTVHNKVQEPKITTKPNQRKPDVSGGFKSGSDKRDGDHVRWVKGFLGRPGKVLNHARKTQVVKPSRAARRPDTEQVRRLGNGDLEIRSRLGPPTGRKGYEKELFPGIEVGLEGWERAHSQGQGTGNESSHGIRYAPREVNQEYQNQGIEQTLRDIYSQKASDVEFELATVTTTHEGTLRLAQIQYTLEAVRNGRRTPVWEASIEINNQTKNPRVIIEARERNELEPFLRPIGDAGYLIEPAFGAPTTSENVGRQNRAQKPSGIPTSKNAGVGKGTYSALEQQLAAAIRGDPSLQIHMEVRELTSSKDDRPMRRHVIITRFKRDLATTQEFHFVSAHTAQSREQSNRASWVEEKRSEPKQQDPETGDVIYVEFVPRRRLTGRNANPEPRSPSVA